MSIDGDDYTLQEQAYWATRPDRCTCGAWRMPFAWCDDACGFLTPHPDGQRAIDRPLCVCGHLNESHDLDDGCGGCALAMRGPCRDFRAAP